MAIVGPSIAEPMTVDFSVLDINTFGITAPDSYNLDGVTFRYDNFGSEYDTAQVDQYGIFGSTYGSVIFDFDDPATGLDFSFSLMGVSSAIEDSLYITFKPSGEGEGGSGDVDMMVSSIFAPYDPEDPTQGGDAVGTLSYSGEAFTQAIMFFSNDAPYFSVSNLSYEPENDPTPVPEPSGLLALSGSLLALGGLIRLRK